MSTEFDIHSIKNAAGTGKTRNFVHLLRSEKFDEKELERRITERCTVNTADTRAVLSAISEVMTEELALGKRVYLPQIGYFDIKLSVNNKQDDSMQKTKGDNVYVKSIGFRPEKQLVEQVREKATFKKSKYTTRSRQYSLDEIEKWVREYIAQNNLLMISDIRRELHVSDYMARNWVNILVEKDIIKKTGNSRFPVYILKE